MELDVLMQVDIIIVTQVHIGLDPVAEQFKLKFKPLAQAANIGMEDLVEECLEKEFKYVLWVHSITNHILIVSSNSEVIYKAFIDFTLLSELL